jgi:hypothetical protein
MGRVGKYKKIKSFDIFLQKEQSRRENLNSEKESKEFFSGCCNTDAMSFILDDDHSKMPRKLKDILSMKSKLIKRCKRDAKASNLEKSIKSMNMDIANLKEDTEQIPFFSARHINESKGDWFKRTDQESKDKIAWLSKKASRTSMKRKE